jgi:hypothetical protein
VPVAVEVVELVSVWVAVEVEVEVVELVSALV